MFKKNKRKNKEQYRLVLPGDIVFVPCSQDVYRKATVIDTRDIKDNIGLYIKFKTGNTAFVSGSLCHKIVKGIAVPLDKPSTKLQRFSLWILRKFGLTEI